MACLFDSIYHTLAQRTATSTTSRTGPFYGKLTIFDFKNYEK